MNGEAGPSSAKPGDVTLPNGSSSHLPEDVKATGSKPARKSEPSFELLPNFSRVTPSQLSHISFPPRGRYQPVRFVSAKPPVSRSGKATAGHAGGKSAAAALGSRSELYGGGGGILVLVDEQPNEDAEYIDFSPPAPTPQPEQPAQAVSPPTAAHNRVNIALDDDEPEATPPPPFEVSHGNWIVMNVY